MSIDIEYNDYVYDVDPTLCHDQLNDDQKKKNYVNIANRCMMLWYQLEYPETIKQA